MLKMIYCYDAYCGWCYGFSPVIRKLADKYKKSIDIEVLSGGMLISDSPKHISVIAPHIASGYKRIEELTGIKFGSDYLWHIENASDSDWFPDSKKAAIALCILKEKFPTLQVEIATALEYALFEEGRDLCDNEAYRHLVELYQLNADEFYQKLSSAEYLDQALYEFSLVRQLQVTGFPVLFLQESESKFHMLAKGYTDFETVNQRLTNVLDEIRARKLN